MILSLLVAVAAAGAAGSSFGLRRGGRASRISLWGGTLALVVVMVLAFALPPASTGFDGTPIAAPGDPFGGYLVTNQYLRLVIGLEALMALLVILAAWLIGGTHTLRGLLPATLAAIAATAVALGSADLGLAVVAAVATGLAALLVVLAVAGPLPMAAAARELRVTLVGVAILLAVVEALPVAADLVLKSLGSGAGTAGSGEAGAVIGLLTLAGTGAVALRYGILPFHMRIPRLSDVVPPISLPLLLAWIPLPLAVAGIAAVDNLVAPLALPLDGERAIVILFAALTLAGVALAAFFQDDLRHVTGYLVIADAGILVLAVAALDPAAWGPTRAWIVVLAASKTAFAAWAAVTEDRFATRSIPDLRGWMRRSPLLAFGLILATVATFGLPGWVAFEARTSIASLAVEGFGAVILVLLGWLTLPTYLRLITVGAGRVTSKVDGAAPERFVRGRGRARPRKDEHLPVELEGGDAGLATAKPVADEPSAASAAPSRAQSATQPEADGAEAGPPSGGSSRIRGLRTRAGAAVASAGGSVASAARSGREAAGSFRAPHADPEPLHERAAAALRRDRAELLAGTVLALALLAALTSWGALDVGGASAEPAPEVVIVGGD